MNRNPDRFLFQEIQFSRINQDSAIQTICSNREIKPSYICFPDSYTVFSATKDTKLIQILNHAWLTMPDGKPIELYAKRKGFKEVTTVSGFWTCKALLQKPDSTHYFYGSRPDVLQNLEEQLRKDFPEAIILGFKSPPFVPLEEIEKNDQIKEDMEAVAHLNPDFLWIGLSSPKQDYLMAHYYKSFEKAILLGVGGVFEYLSGDVKKSPEWIKKLGLRWMYRLLKEPRRLGRKYLFVIKSYIRVMLVRRKK